MVAVVLTAVALLVVPAKTSLAVTYYPHGGDSPPMVWHLTCAPARGTHPTPGRACLETLAARASADLAPPTRPCPFAISPHAPYTRVEGLLRGRPVKRVVRPGCDVAAWRDLHFLLTGA